MNLETESISKQHCCSEMWYVKMVSSEALPMEDGRARSSCTRPRDPHLLECAERNKIDPPIHIEYFHTGGVRGALLAKVPNSSFAEAHRGFSS